jgi:hypothetical protein
MLINPKFKWKSELLNAVDNPVRIEPFYFSYLNLKLRSNLAVHGPQISSKMTFHIALYVHSMLWIKIEPDFRMSHVKAASYES